jgi:hypothetical protein
VLAENPIRQIGVKESVEAAVAAPGGPWFNKEVADSLDLQL